MTKCKVYFITRNQSYEAVVKEGITWETHRKKAPSKLTFDVIKDDVISFQEGDAVRFDYEGKPIFYGFVFTKKRSDNRIITVTAYDQLRYFKNKETYVFKNKTATQILHMIASDFQLNLGVVENTKHVIQTMIEDEQELFTIMDNALSQTLINSKELYVLHDDYGKLNLKSVKALKLDLLIDEESGETFDYTTTIDENVYNKIKLVRENKESGKREIFIAQSGANINQWGVLQYTGKIEEGENGKMKADALLSLYNRKSRILHMNKIFGDVRVRGGSTIGVQMNLGDLAVANFMMVETVKHTFKESEHTMDLKLMGGDFIA